MKITVKIRAFFEKMAGGIHLRRNFATLRSFFEREEQDLKI
jgi:hypothetical protein